MNDAGRIGFLPRGEYDGNTTYDFLDFVYYNGASYVAKKLTVGHEPQESNEYWQILAKGAVDSVNGKTGNVNLTAKDVNALSSHGGTIESEDDALNIYGSGIHGNGNQSLDGFYEINAYHAYIDGEDTDERYVKQDSILTTAEEIEANTNEDNVAGALAVKNMISKINSDLKNKVTMIGQGAVGNTTIKIRLYYQSSGRIGLLIFLNKNNENFGIYYLNGVTTQKVPNNDVDISYQLVRICGNFELTVESIKQKANEIYTDEIIFNVPLWTGVSVFSLYSPQNNIDMFVY